MPGVVLTILKALEPDLFGDDQTRMGTVVEQIFFLCRMIKCLPDTLLPCFTHSKVEHNVESIVAALSQHYKAIGRIPEPRTLAQLQEGIYKHDDTGKNIFCVFDTKPEGQKSKLQLEHTDSVEIENPLNVNTLIKTTTNDLTTSFDSIADEFRRMNVELPVLEPDWKGDLFGAKLENVTDATPKSKTKRKSGGTDQSPGDDINPTAFASKTAVALNEALRKRMKKGDASKGDSSS